MSNASWLDGKNDTEGGLTRTGTVTYSRFVTKTYGDLELRVWEVRYLQDGREKESKEEYSIGKTLVPSADGESLTNPSGKDATLNKNAGARRFRDALQASGFDLNLLKDRVSALQGARLVFQGEPKLDKDGKQKTHTDPKTGKVYEDFVFYPVKFQGFTAAAQAAVAVANGPVKDEAVAIVSELLGAGPLTRAQLISKLGAKLTGNPNSNAIIGLALREDFHAGAPWKRDATGTLSL